MHFSGQQARLQVSSPMRFIQGPFRFSYGVFFCLYHLQNVLVFVVYWRLASDSIASYRHFCLVVPACWTVQRVRSVASMAIHRFQLPTAAQNMTYGHYVHQQPLLCNRESCWCCYYFFILPAHHWQTVNRCLWWLPVYLVIRYHNTWTRNDLYSSGTVWEG